MAQESLYDLFIKALQQIAIDIVTLLPMIILSIVVLAIAILIITLLNRLIRRVLKIINLDGMLRKLVKVELPFSLDSLIILLVDLGIVLIALFGIANLFLGAQHMELMREAFAYGARVISIIIITVFTLMMFEAIIDKVSVETRMRGYVLFILLILITMMIIDLTALSDPTKVALQQGLSMGVGIAVGVFAVWFFFHEYFDRWLRKSAGGERTRSTQDRK